MCNEITNISTQSRFQWIGICSHASEDNSMPLAQQNIESESVSGKGVVVLH